MSPAMPHVQQTTVATASTAAIANSGWLPSATPSATISSAAISSVVRVSPEIGFDDDPITPTR